MSASRRPRSLLPLMTALLLAACGTSGSGQSGSAFVFLSVDLFSLSGSSPVSQVSSSLTDNGTSTTVCVTLRNNLKNPTVTLSTSLDNVVIRSYTVILTRADGGPVPAPFTVNTAVLVPAGSVSGGTLSNNTARVPITLVTAQSKNQPPLSPAPRLPLNAVADVRFKGQDGRGNGVETEGAVGVLFTGGEELDVAASC